MSSKERIKKEIADCINLVNPMTDFLKGKNIDKNYSFHTEYQKFYSLAIKIVEFLAPERYQEFKSYYEINAKRTLFRNGTYVIQDFLKGVEPDSWNHPGFDIKAETLTNLYNQYTILNSIYYRIDSVLADIQNVLFVELQDLELETANALLKVNIRSSGVIAGIVLETYLHKIVDKHGIKITKKNPTLSEFNELLKSNNVYDLTIWRKMTYLADIRNACAHKKDKEPSKEQVEELIDGVNWATKNIF